MEEGIAVLDHVPLVVLHTPGSRPPRTRPSHLLVRCAHVTLLQGHRVVGGHGQLVHLAGVGRADAARKYTFIGIIISTIISLAIITRKAFIMMGSDFKN